MISVLQSLVIGIAILDTSDASYSCLTSLKFTKPLCFSECIKPGRESKFDFRFCFTVRCPLMRAAVRPARQPLSWRLVAPVGARRVLPAGLLAEKVEEVTQHRLWLKPS